MMMSKKSAQPYVLGTSLADLLLCRWLHMPKVALKLRVFNKTNPPILKLLQASDVNARKNMDLKSGSSLDEEVFDRKEASFFFFSSFFISLFSRIKLRIRSSYFPIFDLFIL